MSDSKLPDEGNSAPKGLAGVNSIQLPPNHFMLAEARKLAADKDARVEDLATTISQDPVLVLELIKISNAMYFSGGRPPICSSTTAIVRLGSEVVLETLEKMKERPKLDGEEVNYWLELHRARCKRTAIVCRIVSEAVAKQLADDCQTAGGLIGVGELLAVSHFNEKYVELAEGNTRSSVNYRLAQDYKFDVETAGVNYLRRNGVPDVLLSAIERDGRAKTADRMIMKPICMSAVEMVEAYDLERWEKLAPGKKIPPRSAIRILQMSDSQYLKVYEKVTEYLHAAKAAEDKQRKVLMAKIVQESEALVDAAPDTVAAEVPAVEEPQEIVEESATGSLEDEIQGLMRGEDPVTADPAPEPPPTTTLTNIPRPRDNVSSTQIRRVVAPLPGRSTAIKVTTQKLSTKEAFNLDPKAMKSKVVPRVTEAKLPPVLPTLRTEGGTRVVSTINNMFENSKSSEELLSSLLAKLIDEGPFEKTALIVVSKDRLHALVVAARGPNIGPGQRIALNDPLSPLAQCFSKVQSFGNRENEASPFGSKAFAVAPIDADHDTPVALYADCGTEGSISFEARRIFRNVVDLLNQKLPHIPGGIPVEVSTED
jgi:HD-like signal output (HDOD) protein